MFSSPTCSGAADPDGPLPVTGRDVLYEDVRQLCILEKTLEVDPSGVSNAMYSLKFWDYIMKFHQESPTRSWPVWGARFGVVRCCLPVPPELSKVFHEQRGPVQSQDPAMAVFSSLVS